MSLAPNQERIGLPRWQQRVFWTSLAGAATALVGIIGAFWAKGDVTKIATVTGVSASVAALLGNLGSVFARDSGVGAANEVGERAGVVPPAAEVAPGGQEAQPPTGSQR